VSLDDLRAHSDKLNHHQKIGLKYVEDFETKIPRDEMLLLRDTVVNESTKLDPDFILTVCGSFRRGAQFSNDIDILVTHPKFLSTTKAHSKGWLEKIVNRLVSTGFITDILGFGPSKFMVCCFLHLLLVKVGFNLFLNRVFAAWDLLDVCIEG